MKQSINISGSIGVAALLLFLTISQATAQAATGGSMTENERIVREFVAAWSRLDVDELVDYFAPDGTYYNMPSAPVTGHENLRNFIGGFIRTWEKTDWEIINLMADGDIVMVERMDRTVVGGRTVELPCFGLIEMENGKIKMWRDYFDLATYVDGITPPD